MEARNGAKPVNVEDCDQEEVGKPKEQGARSKEQIESVVCLFCH